MEAAMTDFTHGVAFEPMIARKDNRPNDVSSFEHIVWPYRIVVPILYMLGAYAFFKKAIYRLFGAKPDNNVWFVDGTSINSRRVRDGAATFKALEPTYQFKSGEGDNALIRHIDTYWLHIRNAQAVRNRLKIVKRELRQAILERFTAGQPVRILSIAAGSARAVIEVMGELKNRGIPTEAVLVDQSRSALAYAAELAIENGVSESVRAVRSMVIDRQGQIVDFEGKVEGFTPDIIEMAGLIDYLTDEQILALFAKIKSLLKPNGLLLTCHIHMNHEAFFLWFVVNWKMRYRSRAKLASLLSRANFRNMALFTEPHAIHTVAIGCK